MRVLTAKRLQVVRRFERGFEQQHGRKVTGVDREPVATELKEYRRLRNWHKDSIKPLADNAEVPVNKRVEDGKGSQQGALIWARARASC